MVWIYVVYDVKIREESHHIQQQQQQLNMGNLFSNFDKWMTTTTRTSLSVSVRDIRTCNDDVNFDFMDNDARTQKMTECAYATMTRLRKWEYLRNYIVDENKGFMWTEEPTIIELMREIDHDYSRCTKGILNIPEGLPEEYYDGGHNGSSMLCTLRNMDFIAKHGIIAFREYWLLLHQPDASTTLVPTRALGWDTNKPTTFCSNPCPTVLRTYSRTFITDPNALASNTTKETEENE